MYLRTLKALKLLGDLINGLNKTNNSRQKHFLAWTCFSEAGPTASLKFNSLCFSSLGLLKDFAKSYSSSARPCSNDMESGVLSARQIDPVHYPPCVLKKPFELFGINRGWKAGEFQTCSTCSIAAKGYLARMFDALAWMFVNLHAKLQAAKIAHGGTTSNPSVSRCWLLQGHYVIMDSLHQNATHLGTSKQHLVDHAFDDAFQVLQSYCWRAKKNMYFRLYIWARLLPHTAYHWGTSTCISEAHQRFEHC